MNANDYDVSFPYGATTAPYSPAKPHKGNDRPTPLKTPILIGNTVIGLTGDTGKTEGPHLHTQAGKDLYAQNTVKPDPYEFKPGIVAAIGEASEWGKYVILRVGTKFIVYAHLSKILVKKGDVIKEEVPMVPLAKYKKLEALAEERGKQIKALKAQLEQNQELAKWLEVKVLLRELLEIK